MMPRKIVTAPTLQNIQAAMKLLVSHCDVFVFDDDVSMGIMTAPTISTYEIYANFEDGKGIFLKRGTHVSNAHYKHRYETIKLY